MTQIYSHFKDVYTDTEIILCKNTQLVRKVGFRNKYLVNYNLLPIQHVQSNRLHTDIC